MRPLQELAEGVVYTYFYASDRQKKYEMDHFLVKRIQQIQNRILQHLHLKQWFATDIV